MLQARAFLVRTSRFLVSRRDSDATQLTQHGAPKLVALPGGLLAPVRVRRWRWLPLVLALTLPALGVAIYCFIVASPMFRSELRFFVGGAAEAGGASAFSKMIPSSLTGGGSTSFVDGFAVRDYLNSYEALEELNTRADFEKRMLASKMDPLYTFNASDTREAKLNFFRAMVRPYYNLTEGIISVQVYAYSADDAQAISAGVRELVEKFANRINQKAIEGSIAFAQKEVSDSEERLAAARMALNEWRKNNNNLSPELDVKMIMELITQLEMRYVETKAALDEMARNASLNPGRASLQSKLNVIQERLAAERTRLTGVNLEGSVVNRLLEFQRLTLASETASKAYESAMQSLAGARAVVGYKQKYVLTIVAPTYPQESAYPQPVKTLSLTLLLSLMAYGLGSMIRSVFRDTHAA